MDNEQEKVVEERKRKIKNFLFNKKFLFTIIGLVILLYVAWHVRTVNVPNLKDITTGNYTLGPDLDPFLFARYAESIAHNGKLMTNDTMRYAPLGFNTGEETKLLPYMIAYFHKILGGSNFYYSTIYFPVFMFLLTVIAFFFFIRKIFEKKKNKDIIALIACAFLIVSPSLLPRTVAGIPEKESVAFFFMILTMYFFVSAWQSEKMKKGLLLAVLSGISTGLMALVWGGVRYVYLIIGFAVFLEFIFRRVDKKKIFQYAIWILLTCLIEIVFFSERYNIKSVINAPTSSGFALAILLLLVVDYAIFKTKIKDSKIIENSRKKVPDKFISIIAFIVIGIIILSVMFGISFIIKTLSEIILIFTRTSTNIDRLSYTVAENKQPYFNDWKENFSPMINGIPLIFWVFFIGSIFLFYESFKHLEKKERRILTMSYIIFLFALVFNRYSTSSVMTGENTTSTLVYILGFAVIVGSFIYIYYKNNKSGKLQEFEKVDFSYLFLILFFIVSLMGARNAIRLIMVLAIPVAGIIGFFPFFIIEKIKDRKERDSMIYYALVFVIIFVAIILFYGFYYNYKLTITSTNGMIPSAYTQQWQKAMAWVRTSTPEDSVFAHWWDYGYWLQSIGKRATVVDGGNFIPYWNHLVGRHVLTAQSEKEALEFLYTHNTDYLLIDSTEIGKYGAYSSIGSDENYDRYSLMSTFVEDESSLQETKTGKIHLYRGGAMNDEDYTFSLDGKEEFLPAFKASIGGVLLKEDGQNLQQPQAIFIYNGKQLNIPMRYLYYQNQLYDFKSGYEGALYIVPRLVSQDNRFYVKENGQGLFITAKSMKALWVQLYLFENAENFELVHEEDNFVVKELKGQNMSKGDFIMYGDIQGPIKIWKIKYPAGIEKKKEYLQTEYPESIILVKPSL